MLTLGSLLAACGAPPVPPIAEPSPAVVRATAASASATPTGSTSSPAPPSDAGAADAGAAPEAALPLTNDPLLPTPGNGWEPAEPAAAWGYISFFYGACNDFKPCGTLDPAATWKKGKMSLRAFRARDGHPSAQPQGSEASMTRPSQKIAKVGPSFELKSDGTLFLWATSAPYVIEAQGGFHTVAEENAIRNAFLGWARRIGAGDAVGHLGDPR